MADQSDKLVTITGISGAGRFSHRRNSFDSWLYLGKDIQRRTHVETLLGAENRWQLGGSLHQIASDLRRPFLDFVSDVGSQQKNRLAWWSTTFSWKVWGASDLFLLVCYLGLTRKVSQEAKERGTRLLVVVEDPWLLRQLKENRDENATVVHDDSLDIWGQKIASVSQGLLKRAGWLFRVAGNYRRQRRAWGNKTLVAPSTASVAMYTYPMSRCLSENGGWEDPFLPQLDNFIENLGYEVVRFAPPESSGFEHEIAERHEYFQPLILFASLGMVWRSLIAFWWPRWPRPAKVDDLPVNRLMEREWWTEVSRSPMCIYRLFYECLQKMIGQGQWKWIVYPYENQPWEKMVSLCAQENGVGTVGVQHSAISVYYLSYFLGTSESKHMPLPDQILTSGPYPHELMKKGGNPEDRLKMCGSIRYNHLTIQGDEQPRQLLDPAPGSEILIALPIDIFMSRHLLAAVRWAFPDGGREEGLNFHVKAHPMCPVSGAVIGFPSLVAPADINEAFQNCGTVIYVGSAVGPEAAALGRKVLRYRPELLLDADPAEVFGDTIPTCGDTDMRETVLKMVRNGHHGANIEDTQAAAGQVFAPLDRQMLEEVFRR